MNKIKIAFDLDGVVMNTNPVLTAYYWTQWEIDVSKGKNKFHFDFPEWYPIEDVYNHIADALNNYTKYIVPLRGSDVALKRFHDELGVSPLVFVTARKKTTESVTKQWLDKWISRPYKLHIVEHAKDKKKFFLKNDIDYYVDDRYRTCNELALVINRVYCLNHPWNLGRKFIHRVNRIHDLHDLFYQIFNEQVQKINFDTYS